MFQHSRRKLGGLSAKTITGHQVFRIDSFNKARRRLSLNTVNFARVRWQLYRLHPFSRAKWNKWNMKSDNQSSIVLIAPYEVIAALWLTNIFWLSWRLEGPIPTLIRINFCGGHGGLSADTLPTLTFLFIEFSGLGWSFFCFGHIVFWDFFRIKQGDI